jgi:protein TonB
VGISSVPTRKPEPSTSVHQPIRAMRAQAIYSPDPAPAQLRLTPTGRSSRRTGQSTVAFCVGTGGKVTEVRTTRRFPADPEVDRICRQTVEKWRFRPFIVDGRPRRTCSDVTFSIQFE